MRDSLKLALIAAVTVVLASGCGMFGGGSDNGDDGGGDPREPGEPVSADTVVVEASYPHSYFDGGSADIVIHQLLARDELMQLTFSITTHNPEGDGWNSPTLENTYDGLPVSLVDVSNMNRHVVVADGNQSPLRSSESTALEYGRPTMLTYTFAAPPEDVTNMDVYIGNFPPFTDVPVER